MGSQIFLKENGRQSFPICTRCTMYEYLPMFGMFYKNSHFYARLFHWVHLECAPTIRSSSVHSSPLCDCLTWINPRLLDKNWFCQNDNFITLYLNQWMHENDQCLVLYDIHCLNQAGHTQPHKLVLVRLQMYSTGIILRNERMLLARHGPIIESIKRQIYSKTFVRLIWSWNDQQFYD